jgi:hypothetical protein
MIPFSDDRRTWAIESTIAGKEKIGWIIESAANAIIA